MVGLAIRHRHVGEAVVEFEVGDPASGTQIEPGAVDSRLPDHVEPIVDVEVRGRVYRHDQLAGRDAADLQIGMRTDRHRRRGCARVGDGVRDRQPRGGEVVPHRGVELEGIAELREHIGMQGHARGILLDQYVRTVAQQPVDRVAARGFGEGESPGLAVMLPRAVLHAVRPRHQYDATTGWGSGVDRERFREVHTIDSKPADSCGDLGDRCRKVVAARAEEEFVLVTGGCAHAPHFSDGCRP